MKKKFLEELAVMVIMALIMFGLFILALVVFNKNANKCDEAMGYQCDASQVFNYNKKVD